MNTASLASFLHEIRTPIQTVLGTAELLQATNLNAEQCEYVRQIMFSADVLYTLVNDILDFEKIRTGNLKIDRVPYSVRTLAEQVLDLVSIEAYNKGLELATEISSDIPSELYGDPMRVLQILLNIVKNAVKFTSSGHIVVRISRESVSEKELLLFRVIDTGIGIPSEKKDSIFKEYVQASASTARKYGGTGLGLAICSSLVSLMGGEIGVDDNPGGGSVFWFKLPLDCVEGREDSHPYVVPATTRILVVDDSQLMRDNIRGKLALFGAQDIDTAESGEQAISKMIAAHNAGRDFDIVFVDMTMPSMDGWRFASETNANKDINGAKLYLMIPEGQLGGEARMKMLSWFNGYLYKPIKTHKLQELLQEAVALPFELPVDEDVSATVETDISGGTQVSVPEIAQPRILPVSAVDDVRILAVDDHPVNLKIMTAFLSSFGCKVFTATCGREAVDTVSEHPEIDIVLMDIQMPDINGMEAAMQIRQNGFSGAIIACSANPDSEQKDCYRNSGMNDVLSKPFKKQQLYEVIEKWRPSGCSAG